LTTGNEVRRVRLTLSQIEEPAPTPFVLLVGMIGGVLQSIPSLATQGSTAGALVASLIVGVAAVGLWWVSVRRRRFSVWRTAWHLTLALDLAHMLALSFVLVRIPGKLPVSWLDTSETILMTVVALSPLRFSAATVLLAFGRMLPGSGLPVVPQPLAPSHPAEAI
jgi:hypothetical protein